MKQSRKIRRSWLRIVPEWMRCFARSVLRVIKLSSSRVIKSAKIVGEGCATFARVINSGFRTLDSGLKAHTKEWAAAALAAGLIVTPYSVDMAAGGWQLAAVNAAPQDGVVVGGQATIVQAGAVTNIVQSTQRAAIDWTSFDIAKNETVNFQQPNASAVALNRILGNNPTAIYGQLNANGQVYLSNPNGMLFAPGAQINVAGLIATTSHVDPLAFMQTGLISTGERNGTINMQGSIFASGGLVEIKGATAINVGGLIKATKLNGDGGVITINNAENIIVNGTLDASAAFSSPFLAINSTGNGGHVSIIADKTSGVLNVSGATLRARGGSVNGDGGYIETSGSEIYGLDYVDIDASSTAGIPGTWSIDPLNFTITTGTAALSNTGIGATKLNQLLGLQNIVIVTDNTQGSQAGGIVVNARVTWNAYTSLTLSAYDNIYINYNITNINQGGLHLTADSANLHLAGHGVVSFSPGVTVNVQTATIVAQPLSYNDRIAFTARGGLVGQYRVLDYTDLDNVRNDITANASYTQYADIIATGDFTPIGTVDNTFMANYNGHGKTISNLTFNQGVDGSNPSWATIITTTLLRFSLGAFFVWNVLNAC